MKKPSQKLNSRRFYREVDGRIERTIALEGEPDPDMSQGWVRGLGPIHTQESREKSSLRFRGVPKTPQQLELMRKAKLGVPKSPEHRAAMSQAHRDRTEKLHKIMAEHGVRWGVACDILKQQGSGK